MRLSVVVFVTALSACGAEEKPFAIKCSGEAKNNSVFGDNITLTSETWAIDPQKKIIMEVGADGRTGTVFCTASADCKMRVSPSAVEVDSTEVRAFEDDSPTMRIEKQFRLDRLANAATVSERVWSGESDLSPSFRVRQMNCSTTPMLAPLANTR